MEEEDSGKMRGMIDFKDRLCRVCSVNEKVVFFGRKAFAKRQVAVWPVNEKVVFFGRKGICQETGSQ